MFYKAGVVKLDNDPERKVKDLAGIFFHSPLSRLSV